MRKNKIIFLAGLFSLFCLSRAWADIIFPAVFHQFMLSLVIPGYYSVLMAVLILIVEAYFIKKLFAINVIFSFIFSFIINLISSVSGVFLAVIVSSLNREVFPGIFMYDNMRLGTYLSLLPGYVLTFILEGFLLLIITFIMRKELELKAIFRTSIIMNLYSYLIIFVGIFIADILSKGKVFIVR